MIKVTEITLDVAHDDTYKELTTTYKPTTVLCKQPHTLMIIMHMNKFKRLRIEMDADEIDRLYACIHPKT